jgi:hypothetical protein
MSPEELDHAEGLVNDDTTATSSNATDSTLDVSAGSSAADVKDPKPSLLDVVKAVVEPKVEGAGATSAAEAKETDPEKEAKEAAEPRSEDDFKDTPFGRHPRFKQVLNERNAAVTRARERDAEVERLSGPAGQYASIEQFMQANGLSATEAVQSFKLAALVKNDPEAALTELLPVLVELRKRTGHELPEDIRKDVEEGRITEDRGRELSQARAREARATQRAEAVTHTAETERTQREATEAQSKIVSATEQWEARTRKADPDFAAKEDFIADRARAIIAAEGPPKDPAAAVAIVERAHKDVTAKMRSLVPAKPSLKRPTERSSSTTATAAPTTLRQAIEAAAAGA